MEIRTHNYDMLMQKIKTDEMAIALACTTFSIGTLVEKAVTYLWDFMDALDGNTKGLIWELENTPEVPYTKLFLLYQLLVQAHDMLEECQHFESTSSEERSERKNE